MRSIIKILRLDRFIGGASEDESQNLPRLIPQAEMRAYQNMVESDAFDVLRLAMDRVFGNSADAIAPADHPQVERLNALKDWMESVEHMAYYATNDKKHTIAHAGLRHLGDLTYEQIGLSTNEHNAYKAIRETFKPYYEVIHNLRGRRPNYWEPGMPEPEYDPPIGGTADRNDHIVQISKPDGENNTPLLG